MGRIIVFSITGCKYCFAAKSLLQEYEAPYLEINLDQYPERRSQMTELSQRKTVPQIFFNTDHIGGFDDLNEIHQRGELHQRIDETLSAPDFDDFITDPANEPPMHEQDMMMMKPVPSQHTMGRIVVFSITGCIYCEAAKSLLQEYEAPYLEINLDQYPERRAQMTELSQRKTVPQIFFNDDHIGGFDDLNAIHQRGELRQVIDETLAATDVHHLITDPAEEQQMPEQDMMYDNDKMAMAKDHDSSGEKGAGLTRWEELKKIAEEMRNGWNRINISDRRYRLKTYKKCFVGKDAVEWHAYNGKMDKAEALKLMEELFEHRFIHHVARSEPFRIDGEYFYRFQMDEEHTALNTDHIYTGSVPDANQLSGEIRQKILELYNDFLSADGNAVDYDGIAESDKFESFSLATEKLQKIDVAAMDNNEKLAFWINIYNACVVHGRVKNGAPQGFLQRTQVFDKTKYNIGGLDYSLNDMENGVLRLNRRGPSKLTRQFGSGDPRAKAMLTRRDPRIHFALVCGAKSCPPIKLYSAKGVDDELTLAAEAFCESEVEIDVASNTVTLSKILDWYSVDFGRNPAEILAWVRSFVNPAQVKEIDQVLARCEETKSQPKFEYRPYDWGPNSK